MMKTPYNFGQKNKTEQEIRLDPKFDTEEVSKSGHNLFKRRRLFDPKTTVGTTYVDSKVFDARFYKTILAHLTNPNATLALDYKLLACLDPESWSIIVSETELAALADVKLAVTDAWAFLKLQVKAASEFDVVSKCFSHTTEGDVWIDETDDANDAGINDVKLPPHSNYPSDRRDYIYYGGNGQFPKLAITIENGSQKSYPDNPLMKWEYWNGEAWTELSGVVDETDGSRNYGVAMEVTYTMPSDWAKNAVNGETYYWIRFGGYANQSSSAPTATQIWFGGAKAFVKAYMSGKK